MNIDCDSYVLKALEVEMESLNRFNIRAGLATIDVSEVAREVLADWAIKLLLERTSIRMPTD